KAIELCSRLIEKRGPGRAAVGGHRGAAVIGFDHPQWIVRRDPEIVIVAVRRTNCAPRLAAVLRLVEGNVWNVDRVFIFRIGVDARVVPRALADVGVIAGARPGFAGVTRAIEAAVLRLDNRIDILWIRWRDADPDNA